MVYNISFRTFDSYLSTNVATKGSMEKTFGREPTRVPGAKCRYLFVHFVNVTTTLQRYCWYDGKPYVSMFLGGYNAILL